MRVKIVPIETNYKLVVKKVVNISDDLDYEFKRQARLYAIVSRYHVLAKRRVKNLNYEMNMLVSVLRKKIRKVRAGRLTKDDYVEEYMKKSSYRDKLAELDDAISDEETLSGILRALDHRKDMLVGLGANHRHELGSDLRSLKEYMSKEVKRQVENIKERRRK